MQCDNNCYLCSKEELCAKHKCKSFMDIVLFSTLAVGLIILALCIDIHKIVSNL